MAAGDWEAAGGCGSVRGSPPAVWLGGSRFCGAGSAGSLDGATAETPVVRPNDGRLEMVEIVAERERPGGAGLVREEISCERRL